MPTKPTAAFFTNGPLNIDHVYGPGQRSRLDSLVALLPGIHGDAALADPGPDLAGVEVVFSTWGMPSLDAKALEKFPELKAVFYAAGSVRYFAQPFLEKGIAVVSAWAANGEPVAEFTLAQILLANKRFLPAQAALRRNGVPAWRQPKCAGNFGVEVSLLGAGMIGRRVIELLKPFAVKVLVFDPFLGAEAAAGLGVEKTGLEEAFARGQVVSNHLANVPETRGLITGALLKSMPPDATFLNTGRGATVDEPGLWKTLRERPDLCAVLDVTDPEPPEPDSPAYRLENVFLSPHIAGSLVHETRRMSSLVIDEFEAWRAGRPLRYAVTREMLKTMA